MLIYYDSTLHFVFRNTKITKNYRKKFRINTGIIRDKIFVPSFT